MNDLVAVYGTLRRGGRLHHHLGIAAGRSLAVGHARIAGDLYEVAPERRDTADPLPYPCYYEGGDGRVVVELYEVVDHTLWADLDELEGFVPHDPEGSEYHRRRVTLLDVQVDRIDRPPSTDVAWTYVYVHGAADPARHITGGDWIAAAR
jgi:gamma-glutamylcyclotransferase (GGCT)/AIG2-like uncharacterized protein YtfP